MHQAWTYAFVPICTSLVLVLAMTGALAFDQNKPPQKPTDLFVLDVEEPRRLGSRARQGKAFYQRKCVSCHGESGRGSAKGPPLIVYERSDHSDEKFRDAVRNGVPQHHFKYGDMPAIKGASDKDIANLISYIRALQDYQDQQDEEP